MHIFKFLFKNVKQNYKQVNVHSA